MLASEALRDKAKVLVLFTFCLLNPFAGWAYLAQVRQERWLRPPVLSDTLKPTRLAVLPLTGGELDQRWAESFEVDFAEVEHLEVVPISRTRESLDEERDVLALGRSVRADLVLDGRALVADGVASVYVRLIRMADASVRWSELFLADPGEWAELRERVRFATLTSL